MGTLRITIFHFSQHDRACRSFLSLVQPLQHIYGALYGERTAYFVGGDREIKLVLRIQAGIVCGEIVRDQHVYGMVVRLRCLQRAGIPDICKQSLCRGMSLPIDGVSAVVQLFRLDSRSICAAS